MAVDTQKLTCSAQYTLETQAWKDSQQLATMHGYSHTTTSKNDQDYHDFKYNISATLALIRQISPQLVNNTCSYCSIGFCAVTFYNGSEHNIDMSGVI